MCTPGEFLNGAPATPSCSRRPSSRGRRDVPAVVDGVEAGTASERAEGGVVAALPVSRSIALWAPPPAAAAVGYTPARPCTTPRPGDRVFSALHRWFALRQVPDREHDDAGEDPEDHDHDEQLDEGEPPLDQFSSRVAAGHAHRSSLFRGGSALRAVEDAVHRRDERDRDEADDQAHEDDDRGLEQRRELLELVLELRP